MFNFSLSREDMIDLEYLDCNWRGCIPSDVVGGVSVYHFVYLFCLQIDGVYIVRDFKHPFYPFHIAY